MSRDYSQPGDPYGIAEYTSQSADQDMVGPGRRDEASAVDVRGNSVFVPRSIPTQAEADALKQEAR
jgi:hypothetical protein